MVDIARKLYRAFGMARSGDLPVASSRLRSASLPGSRTHGDGALRWV